MIGGGGRVLKFNLSCIMSFYLYFVSDNFAQKFNQNARFGIFICKIFWRRPHALTSQQEDVNPFPNLSPPPFRGFVTRGQLPLAA